jgi:GrpB-like predicted nucleotidyltransferase (UPF0157 family)
MGGGRASPSPTLAPDGGVRPQEPVTSQNQRRGVVPRRRKTTRHSRGGSRSREADGRRAAQRTGAGPFQHCLVRYSRPAVFVLPTAEYDPASAGRPVRVIVRLRHLSAMPRCMGDDTELIGGVERREIVVVAYDPDWPGQFTAERTRIVSALGDTARRVDHIGSTSVPGLDAKPIIDIDLSVPDPENESSYLPALELAGYHLRVRQPGHRMVRSTDLGVHVHVCAQGSDWDRRPLLFRDWLRHDEADRSAYAALKHELAAQPWPDMNAYAAAKGPLIAEITTRAEDWARTVDWRPTY